MVSKPLLHSLVFPVVHTCQTYFRGRNFSKKIQAACKKRISKDFFIIARIESFILDKGVDDAIYRASIYISNGADGIMIHSKSESTNEILSFCKRYEKFKKKVPLVVVPSTYNRVIEEELINIGVDVVIYANHLLRSSYPAMINTAKSILENKRSYEANKSCLPIKEVLELIPNDYT